MMKVLLLLMGVITSIVALPVKIQDELLLPPAPVAPPVQFVSIGTGKGVVREAQDFGGKVKYEYANVTEPQIFLQQQAQTGDFIDLGARVGGGGACTYNNRVVGSYVLDKRTQDCRNECAANDECIAVTTANDYLCYTVLKSDSPKINGETYRQTRRNCAVKKGYYEFVNLGAGRCTRNGAVVGPYAAVMVTSKSTQDCHDECAANFDCIATRTAHNYYCGTVLKSHAGARCTYNGDCINGKDHQRLAYNCDVKFGYYKSPSPRFTDHPGCCRNFGASLGERVRTNVPTPEACEALCRQHSNLNAFSYEHDTPAAGTTGKRCWCHAAPATGNVYADTSGDSQCADGARSCFFVGTNVLPTDAPIEDTLFVSVDPGTTNADKAFWEAQCPRLPADTKFVKVVMGTVTDYFKPVEGNTVCQMLMSNNKHQWSADGQTWQTPPYSLASNGNSNFLGGCEYLWPKNNVAGDNRNFVSFWGGHGTNGGCCHNSLTDVAAWQKSFTMFYSR